MNNSNLIKLQHFFEVDTKIKKEMYDILSSAGNDYFDEQSLCNFSDSLAESLNYIFSELKCVALDIYGQDSEILSRVFSLEETLKNNFYSCGLDKTKLLNFCKTYISNMEPSFVDEVKSNCIGYALYTSAPVNKANSINEILHLIHSSIVNDNGLLQSIPLLGEKQNNYNYPISLRGVSSETFNQLFNQFPNGLDVGWTDMVSLSDKKLLMMVRDRGHALTIEVTLNNDVARLEYFIPKICNIDMVNALPGVNKVNNDNIGTTGVIEINKNDLSETLFDFISKVPTDSDRIDEYKTL